MFELPQETALQIVILNFANRVHCGSMSTSTSAPCKVSWFSKRRVTSLETVKLRGQDEAIIKELTVQINLAVCANLFDIQNQCRPALLSTL